jgi:hypothetical protein
MSGLRQTGMSALRHQLNHPPFDCAGGSGAQVQRWAVDAAVLGPQKIKNEKWLKMAPSGSVRVAWVGGVCKIVR